MNKEELEKILDLPEDQLTPEQELICMQYAIEFDRKTRCSKCGSGNLKITYPIMTEERFVFCFDCKYKTKD